jgi:hypothetical protein
LHIRHLLRYHLKWWIQVMRNLRTHVIKFSIALSHSVSRILLHSLKIWRLLIPFRYILSSEIILPWVWYLIVIWQFNFQALHLDPLLLEYVILFEHLVYISAPCKFSPASLFRWCRCALIGPEILHVVQVIQVIVCIVTYNATVTPHLCLLSARLHLRSLQTIPLYYVTCCILHSLGPSGCQLMFWARGWESAN